ncbi:sporulation protein YjcZ [Paenibacillus guangzhouensis]|nr:sporulation protein YjcZ [Paenibacillus guangzhouensis]
MSGFVGGAFTSTGTILVLFILLVIIACSCMRGFGGFGY